MRMLCQTEKKNTIGEKIVQLRKMYHLSQRGLAMKLQLAGVDVTAITILRIEKSKCVVLDIELMALCEVFGVTTNQLLGFGN